MVEKVEGFTAGQMLKESFLHFFAEKYKDCFILKSITKDNVDFLYEDIKKLWKSGLIFIDINFNVRTGEIEYKNKYTIEWVITDFGKGVLVCHQVPLDYNNDCNYKPTEEEVFNTAHYVKCTETTKIINVYEKI